MATLEGALDGIIPQVLLHPKPHPAAALAPNFSTQICQPYSQGYFLAGGTSYPLMGTQRTQYGHPKQHWGIQVSIFVAFTKTCCIPMSSFPLVFPHLYPMPWLVELKKSAWWRQKTWQKTLLKSQCNLSLAARGQFLLIPLIKIKWGQRKLSMEFANWFKFTLQCVLLTLGSI